MDIVSTKILKYNKNKKWIIILMKNNGKYTNELAEFGKKLLENNELDKGLVIISEYLKTLKNAMRCSIFIYDKEKNVLWTILADGIEKIIVPMHQGIVGHVYMTGESMIENDVSRNPYFLKEIDKGSGYQTVNMIACPIHDSRHKTIGVLQLLNKLEGFTEADLEFLNVFTNFIASFIELVPFYQEK